MSEFPLLDERQVQGLAPFFQRLLLPAHAADPTAPMPPPAVLVTVAPPVEALTATVAWVWDIQVRATLPEGQRLILGCADLLGCLLTQPALLRGVEPVTPSLAFVLYVHDLLWAWDFRALGVALAGNVATTLLRMGDEPVKAKRARALHALAAYEQAQGLHDVVTADLFVAPQRLRVPLRGILHAGWHAFDTGDVADPFRLLRYFEAVLGVGRRAATPVSALPPADAARYHASPAPACPDDIEDFIQDLTATLPVQERVALQHWLRAKHLGIDFQAYCAQLGLPHEATRKAALRGRDSLNRSH